MKINPVKGTADYLPSQTLLRDYLQNVILDTYRAAGFERIMTPAIEDMENLEKSEGGDNLNLMFKILKRGEKLDAALAAGDSSQLADLGLRYDLTLPLSRFYAGNRSKLSNPFKCIQIDKSYRAERPQKGRMREFVQCDIDILGSDSPLCELELIHTTATALLKLDIGSFTIRINDRRVLKGVLNHVGIPDEQMDTVCVTLDKWDKIGTEGVLEELAGKGLDAEVCGRIRELLDGGCTLEQAEQMCGQEQIAAQLRKIIEDANTLAQGRYDVVFDMLLIRGQGYYTGTVFEIQSNKFRGAVGGGGRYDDLTGIFGMPNMSGVGISFGADRIYDVMTGLGLFPADLGCAARVMFANLGEAEEHASLKLLQEVRAAGIPAEIYPENGKMKKQMEYANRRGIPCVVIVGSRELEERVATIKDMTSGEQTQVPFTRLAEALR